MSSPPPATTTPMVWPPSNPSGTVIPFPLPWGQTGCCPPGGMSALMQCYCDIQQASAFIAQIMIDQINNNPDVVAAIIAAIEKSGSNLPLVGVTNGSNAQPGQVGEFISMPFTMPFPIGSTGGLSTSAGVLQPGDWDMWVVSSPTAGINTFEFGLSPSPAGQGAPLGNFYALAGGETEAFVLMSTLGTGSYSVPTLMAFTYAVGGAAAAGVVAATFYARRVR